MTEIIRVISLHYECHLCPMVLAGKTDTGATIYARYRWGHLTVRIDPREAPPFGGAAGAWIFAAQIGDDLEGWITYDRLREVTKGLIEWPETEPIS
jgi:hypothetical protein